jgi:hypothetical protein
MFSALMVCVYFIVKTSNIGIVNFATELGHLLNQRFGYFYFYLSMPNADCPAL